MLTEQSAEGPRISAVLDADRAWWRDPMADWTAHLFRIKTKPRILLGLAAFQDEYGARQEGQSASLRALVYDAMHTGKIMASAKRRNRARVLAESSDRMDRIAAALKSR